MKEETPNNSSLPLGLWELDRIGTVLYYKSSRPDEPPRPSSEVVGRNFFSEVAPGLETGELKERFKSFQRSLAPAQSLNLTLDSEQGCVRTRVLLARIQEKSEQGNIEAILLHIRKVEPLAA
jgi:photoactive yellow protein